MQPLSAEKLYPYVIPNGYVDWTEPGMWVHWPVSPEVYIGLSFDCDGIVRNARPEELEQLGLGDEGAAFDKAAENLAHAYFANKFAIGAATLKDGLAVACARDGWMAPPAGLLIREFYELSCDHLKADTLVAIPLNQQFLVAFRDDEQSRQSASLRALIDEQYTDARKPISRSWLLLNGSWPQPYPGSAGLQRNDQ